MDKEHIVEIAKEFVDIRSIYGQINDIYSKYRTTFKKEIKNKQLEQILFLGYVVGHIDGQKNDKKRI